MLKQFCLMGRPNVGKSCLFNALVGFPRSIVSETSGTTRDLVVQKVCWDGKWLQLTDTQGTFGENDEAFIQTIIERSEGILFVVDAKSGISPFDRWLARQVLSSRKPALLCVNKSEGHRVHEVTDFAELGFESYIGVSAVHRKNIEEIKSWCVSRVEVLESELEKPRLTIALIGKPNTGKSTLINWMGDAEVSRVSPEPLTTRDPVGCEIKTAHGWVQLIDTAGIRRAPRIQSQIELDSVRAAKRIIRRADVVFLLIASHEALSDQDVRLLNLVAKEGKSALVCLNFWDKLNTEQKKERLEAAKHSSWLYHLPSIPISGLTGLNIERLIPLAEKLQRKSNERIPTAKLNRIVGHLIENNPPPSGGRGNFNILYASQVASHPPTFVFFVNRKQSLPLTYKKYIEKQLREKLQLRGQPLRLVFRAQGVRR
ncbi:MAG: ribosome biogenesis GTPase Der [Deltaproteobacteria bacterium]|nr:ribosome biogenesis GTPase Der [Deltaproteobacteria bacterium]